MRSSGSKYWARSQLSRGFPVIRSSPRDQPSEPRHGCPAGSLQGFPVFFRHGRHHQVISVSAARLENLLQTITRGYQESPGSLNVDLRCVGKAVEIHTVESEIDALWSFVGDKANQPGVWPALTRRTRQMIAFHVGIRVRIAPISHFNHSAASPAPTPARLTRDNIRENWTILFLQPPAQWHLPRPLPTTLVPANRPSDSAFCADDG